MSNNPAYLLRNIIKKLPIVAPLYRYIRDTRALKKDPKITPLGFKFNGNKQMEEGTFEPQETALIKTLLSKVDVVINIGANIGYYTCLCLQNGKHVVAFEPMPLNLIYLYRNIVANNWQDKVEIFPLALSNTTGIITIYGGNTGASLIPGWSGVSEEVSTTVPMATLNNVLGDRFLNEKFYSLLTLKALKK